MQDTIERNITVKASKLRVYEAISNPEQIVKWFPDRVEGKLEVGQQPILYFNDHSHKSRIYVESARPHDYFAFRWVPGGSSGLVEDVLQAANTLVEFKLEETPEGTKVILKESGFASLPDEVAEGSFKDNSGGWGFMMGRLEKMLSKV